MLYCSNNTQVGKCFTGPTPHRLGNALLLQLPTGREIHQHPTCWVMLYWSNNPKTGKYTDIPQPEAEKCFTGPITHRLGNTPQGNNLNTSVTLHSFKSYLDTWSSGSIIAFGSGDPATSSHPESNPGHRIKKQECYH